MSFGVVLAAAGMGKRMGSKEPKQFIQLDGKPILYHSVSVFHQIKEITEMIVVTSAEDIPRTQKILAEFPNVKVVAGGSERQESVFRGLDALAHVDYVLIHDAARPFVSTDLIEMLMEQVVLKGAVIPAVPVKDTIKIVDHQREVVSTPPRESLWAVQTPQAFRLSNVLAAHQQANKENFLGTDDAMLMEWLGEKVFVVQGEYTNIKLTTPEDLHLGKTILEGRRN